MKTYRAKLRDRRGRTRTVPVRAPHPQAARQQAREEHPGWTLEGLEDPNLTAEEQGRVLWGEYEHDPDHLAGS